VCSENERAGETVNNAIPFSLSLSRALVLQAYFLLHFAELVVMGVSCHRAMGRSRIAGEGYSP
jgi:hypothetical protein